MIGLFLDDERNPEDVTWIQYPDNIEWIVVRDSAEFADKFWDIMKSGKDYVVSFDHDIQDFYGQLELTGYSNLKVMLDAIHYYGLIVPVCYFHTKNPIGKKNMEMYYKNFVEFYAEEMEK